MAKFFPVIGELYTAAESALCLVGAGIAKVVGDDEGAETCLESVGKAWEEYAEGNLIVTPILGIAADLSGDHKTSQRLEKKYKDAVGGVMNGTPVIGHVKGIVHYCMGDEEKGNRCMESATRTTAVLGAGILTGGLGAGAAAGACAGLWAGTTYDCGVTIADAIVNKDKARPHGHMALLLEGDKMDPNQTAQALLGIAGDCMSGASGARLGKQIRAELSKTPGQKNLSKAYSKAKVKDPEGATKVTMEAAKAAKKVQDDLGRGGATGSTCMAVDTANGKSGIGHSARIQAEKRAQNLANGKPGIGHSAKIQAEVRAQNHQKLKTTESSYPPSINAVKKGNGAVAKSHLQNKYRVKVVSNIPQNTCAEHGAFTDLHKNSPWYKAENIRTASVVHKKGVENYVTKPRCLNCREYGSAMGDVVTDKIPEHTPVPLDTYIDSGTLRGAFAKAYVAASSQQRRAHNNMSLPEPSRSGNILKNVSLLLTSPPGRNVPQEKVPKGD